MRIKYKNARNKETTLVNVTKLQKSGYNHYCATLENGRLLVLLTEGILAVLPDQEKTNAYPDA